MGLDRLAERGFAARADVYEAGRPEWPRELVERLLAELALGPSSTVVDLGAGTGKLARQVVGAVGRVVAVEPSRAMREECARLVPRAEVVDGSAEAIPLPDASVDAVLAAEAFHWFATPAAVAEIARVVRPGGGLGLLWNVHAWTGDETAMREVGGMIMSRRAPGKTRVERMGSGEWRDVIEGSGAFGPLGEAELRWELQLDLDAFIRHVSTWSFIAALEDGERHSLLSDVESALRERLAPPADVVVPYRTLAYWAQRV